MPQQVLNSPKAPESADTPRPKREREHRVAGDAGAFGILLGTLRAVQDGGAGIVRGKARDDSAAEWNARDARESRQDSRLQPAQPAPHARESHDQRAAQGTTQAPANASPSATAAAQDESSAPPSPAPTSDANRAPSTTINASGPGPDASATNPATQPTQSTAAFRQALANVGGLATASAPAARAAIQSQPSGTIDASRGPQGGVARGRPEIQNPGHAERTKRFERVFQGQLTRGLAQALRSGEGTVTLRLRPQALGPLTVRVEVAGQQVRATFEARTVEAQQLLEGSRDVLKHQLESRGLQVDRIEVRLLEEAVPIGTRLAMDPDGGADGGQDGRAFADDRSGRGGPGDGGAAHRAWRGAPREEAEPAAGAEPWRALGTLGLDAIA